MDISVIIPLHEVRDLKLLKNAIDSVELQKTKAKEVILVVNNSDDVTKKMLSEGVTFDSSLVRTVINNDEQSFQSQVNCGVKESRYEYVSILEFDDEFSDIWFKNVVEYNESYPEFDVFLPITLNVIQQDGNHMTVGFSNEAPLAKDFTNKMCVIDMDTTLTYPNFTIVGAVIKKSIFEENGYFKNGIKYTYIYEFILRQLENSVKFYVIPRIGYKHLLDRENSISFNNKSVTRQEGKFWMDVAKREFYTKKDRPIEYKSFE